jgi:hypothetical protein
MLFGAQYHSRKEQLKLAKNFLKNEIVMLAIFVLICVMIASLVDKNTP